MTSIGDYKALDRNIFRLLDVDGDGTGSTDGAVDGSSTPVELKMTPPEGEIFEISRMIVNIQSSGILATQKYGDLAALTNGLKILVGPSASRTQIPDIDIKTHDDWASVCHDSIALNYGNVAGKTISIRWSFFKAGCTLWLDGDKGDELVVQINDDLEDLVKHIFQVQGLKHIK